MEKMKVCGGYLCLCLVLSLRGPLRSEGRSGRSSGLDTNAAAHFRYNLLLVFFISKSGYDGCMESIGPSHLINTTWRLWRS